MKKIVIGLGLAAAAVSGCGGNGGGEGGDDVVNAGGIWRGTATLTQNACNLQVGTPTLSFTHTVSQNESAVTLDSDSGDHFLGNAVGNDGFSVDSASRAFSFGNVVCTMTPQIQYNGISGERGDNNENSADVTVKFMGSCAVGGQCELNYTGAAVRGVGPVPSATPTAVPTPGASPVPTAPSGACSAVNQRPYAGDLGCGLGAATLSTTATGITLEPFGVNGLTTFNGPAGAQTVTSVRSDLTILNVAGYSCSVDCAPPAEFIVRCSQEGGTSCREKF